MTISSAFLLSFSWIVFFALHSLFASLQFKAYITQHWPKVMPAYRLLFNGISIVLLPIPVTIQHHYTTEYLWQWTGFSAIVANGIALTAMLVFLWTLKYYDSSDFSGLKQLREGIAEAKNYQHFTLSPFHRYVRHPWYFLILIILWSRSMDEARLISSLLITAYFFLGSQLEENKLMIYHGDIYRNYRKKVPAIIPVPWKYLKKSDQLAP
jgi:protein-S-isoprenylcysteine O-methyltransferase Ste14